VSHVRRPRPVPFSDETPDDWRWQVWALVTDVEPAEAISVLARAVLLAGLGVWSLRFFAHSLQAGYLFGSFMHLVHLPFHEAGHILFMPFGRFLKYGERE
jgi:hypothetical protein